MRGKKVCDRDTGGILVRIVALIALMSVFSAAGDLPGKEWTYVPDKLPAGFTVTYGPEYYGTEEKPRKNGSLYDYINGGGEVYIKHGFREVMHVVLGDREGNEITLDVFNMGTPANAASAFADEAICAQGHNNGNIGPNSKEYRYTPDYILYFIKGKYLVSLSLSNDRLADDVKRFAAAIYKTVK